MNSPWVIIPTYNERPNIAPMIRALFSLNIPGLSVLIVDDSSPDGTGEDVKKLQAEYPRLQLTLREKKSGLGRAYIHGFGQVLKLGATAVVQMDADFSHDPKDVPRLLAALKDHDVVIGSRYSHGISVINWPLRRLLLSTAANQYARIITGLKQHDITGGFRAWRPEVLRAIELSTVHADGYGFQIVTIFRTAKKNFRITEIPIIFTERREGQSKKSTEIMWEAFWLVWKLRLFG